MSSLISEAIKKVFSSDFNELEPSEKPRWSHFNFGITKKRGFLIILLILLLLYVYYLIYFYNRIKTLETSLLTAKAQINVRMQLRKNVMINLVKTVKDYAEYERDLFKYVVEQRVNMMNPSDKKSETNRKKEANLSQEEQFKNLPPNLLEQLNAIAENYPELQSSNHYQKLIDALVDIEKLIGDQKRAYNEAVNNYDQFSSLFPNNVFYFTLHFKKYQYIQVDDDVEAYKEIRYK